MFVCNILHIYIYIYIYCWVPQFYFRFKGFRGIEKFEKGCSRRNGKREESSRQTKISGDRQHYDKWTVRIYEKEG